MRRTVVTLLGTATAVASAAGAVLGIAGCSSPDRATSEPLSIAPPSIAAPTPDPGPLPPPEALSDVMYRLADPAVAGPDKLALVQDTAPPDAAAFDRFAAALRDTGFAPLRITATELRWSPSHAGDVLATIRIVGTDDDKPGEFSFPMEFHDSGSGWQLTRETADMLLAFGNARADTPPASAPTTPPP